MSSLAAERYDVAIVGAGPVGSLCALAHAQKGARVALLEANPKASLRLAGEWLHPPAVRMLRAVGIAIDEQPRSSTGEGFAVFPEDGSEPIVLPYPKGECGVACDHTALVARLHEAVEDEPDIDFLLHAKVREVEDGQLAFARNGTLETLAATSIVGADGRSSVVRQSLGLPGKRIPCSRMVGVVVEDAELPVKGYGHVLLGAPGPILAYHTGARHVRIIADIPLDHWSPKDRANLLSESYAELLPEALKAGFIKAVQSGKFHAAANELRPRVSYGTWQRTLIGDAAGHYHPLTAVGMTLGFGDALMLAKCQNFNEFKRQRFRDIRAPELLAMGMYEVFADHRGEAVALRTAMYQNWLKLPIVRDRTMRLLACEDRSIVRLGLATCVTALRALTTQTPHTLNRLAWRRTGDVMGALASRVVWFLHGVDILSKLRRNGDNMENRFREVLARSFLISVPPEKTGVEPAAPKDTISFDASPALHKAGARLLSLQGDDGAWEGEMVWCPMLTAQYVLLQHLLEQPIEAGRRRRILRSFACSRLDNGLWSLHEHPPANLFVTTLVYVAARLLGLEQDDTLLKPAQRFLQAEGVRAIPSWGKFWLALLNLYDWRGVNAILPELWGLPRRLPLHPSNWYCHTRLIYMAMASVYAHRYQAPVTTTIAALREELYPQGYEQVDFVAGRNDLRAGDLFARPGVWLRAGYALTRLYERYHNKRLRNQCLEALRGQISWELQSSSHTSISPVSGFLNILALWLRDPDDADCRQALAKLDDWFWEDEEHGARVTGARSSSWDTGFALQALATAPDVAGAPKAMRKGAEALRNQQIQVSFEGYKEAYRNDPQGGWCFPGGWHGWPVSDCTAEAALGIMAVQGAATNPEMLAAAARFMLRSQNRDGGFGSYEAQRSRFDLEWLNPAEMFGESMTEHSYVECTASCMAALAACREHAPQSLPEAAPDAMSRAESWLRNTQSSDGSWRGVWGVQFIYGTLFGIRGLIAAGARPGDPALRLACRWLLERQREDGGWGESLHGCLSGEYVPHEESQIIQSAWALIALLEAGESNWPMIVRGIRYLAATQNEDGSWPRQDMAGVFFRTAMLDYVLYRQYFPLHALGLYERRRRARAELAQSLNPLPKPDGVT